MRSESTHMANWPLAISLLTERPLVSRSATQSTVGAEVNGNKKHGYYVELIQDRRGGKVED
jgi:hypothetical protein